ncbi:hypothetical protein CHS0354_021125 [Potamilus streckersoni]|uniref:Kringle domain-containing protein n=1 Tax=Potamilus streckersoni TaxID=2493646 RepID=A0AAE0T5V9_9BIVA|nr:hypothetical protein CHS0354_021125 [Potamilus streckersoni]
MEIRTIFFFIVSAVITVTYVLSNEYENSCFLASSHPRRLAQDYIGKLQELTDSLSVDLGECSSPKTLKRVNSIRNTLTSFQHDLTDCFTESTTYTGKRNCTISGYQCINWDSKVPQEHELTQFPDDSIKEAGNYCRDPNGKGLPWCYIKDPIKKFEICPVPNCAALE